MSTAKTAEKRAARRGGGLAKRAIQGSVVALGLFGALFEGAAYAGPPTSGTGSGSGSGSGSTDAGAPPAARPNGSGPCTVATESTDCQSGSCSPNAGVCIPASGGCEYDGGACTPVVVATCDSDGGPSTCTTGNGTCAVDADCEQGDYCDGTAYKCRATASVGSPPSDGHACPASGTEHACSTGRCNVTLSTCADANGAACTSAASCASNICDQGFCGFADGDGACDPASGSAMCRSGSCAPSGVCLQSSECAKDVDCAGGDYCDPVTKACAAPRANGQTYPTDVGTCSSHGSGVVSACKSGACNAITDTCAGANGAVCRVGDECVSGVCGTNGLCGWANGTTGCTAATASACQSGTCDASGMCKPASSGSCATDGECTSGQFCDHITFTCAAVVGTGSVIPNDGAHACSANSTSGACASGECSTRSGRCVASNGDACSASSDCASLACGSDGKCGFVTGASARCASSAQCRTGFCDTGDGGAAAGTVCVQCEADYQCGSAKFCSEIHECHALLANAMRCQLGTQCSSGLCADGICGGATKGTGINTTGGETDGGASVSVAGVGADSLAATGGKTPEGATANGIEAGCSTSGAGSSSSGAGFFFTALGLGWVVSRRKKARATP